MSELRHGDIKTFSLPVGSLLTVTTVTGEAYVNQVSTARTDRGGNRYDVAQRGHGRLYLCLYRERHDGG